jgi:hypothetical protein
VTRAPKGSLEWEQQHEFLCPDPDALVPCGEKCAVHDPEDLLSNTEPEENPS